MANTITSYNVVGHTGGDDTAMLNSAFAGAASRPVFLSFGTYNVSGPLTIADYGVVVGEEINAWDYYNGVRPRTLLQVTNPNSFAQNPHNPSAVVNVGNYSHIRGFSIFGEKNFNAGTNVAGVRVNNKAFVTIQDIWANLCYAGFWVQSDGSIAGGSPWGNNNIGCRIYGGGTLYNYEWGILAGGVNGGYFSDAQINNVQVVSNGDKGIWFGNGVTSTQVTACRIEDQTYGFFAEESTNILLNGCIFDRNLAPITFDSCAKMTVTGCNSSAGPASSSGYTCTHVNFLSNALQPQAMSFAGNTYMQGAAATSYAYGVDINTKTMTGYFAEDGTPGFNTAIFQDSNTQSVIAPLMVKLGP
jgi:hypothetical protein